MASLKSGVFLIPLVMLSVFPSKASAGTVNLQAGWKATSPAGYEMAQDGGFSDTHGTTTGHPIKQIVNNWTSLAPISTQFANNQKLTDVPVPLDHFFLSMEFTNNTNQTWTGFIFTAVDGNGRVVMAGDPLFHPFPAHFHTDFFDPATVGFTNIVTIPPYNDLGDNRGVFSIKLFGGFAVKPGETWKPKLLNLHDRAVDDGTNYVTNFTLIEQPLVPLPSSVSMGAVLLGVLAITRLLNRFFVHHPSELREDRADLVEQVHIVGRAF